MSRTVFSIKTNADPNVVMQFLSIELPRIGYANKSTAYEPVWKRGDGVMIKAQCISVSFSFRAKWSFPPGSTTRSSVNPTWRALSENR